MSLSCYECDVMCACGLTLFEETSPTRNTQHTGLNKKTSVYTCWNSLQQGNCFLSSSQHITKTGRLVKAVGSATSPGVDRGMNMSSDITGFNALASILNALYPWAEAALASLRNRFAAPGSMAPVASNALRLENGSGKSMGCNGNSSFFDMIPCHVGAEL